MNNGLIAFLKQREPNKVVEFVACKDWKDEKGNPVKWKFKKLTSKELSDIRGKYSRINHKKKDIETNDTELLVSIVANSVVYPNLKDVQLADTLFPDAPLDQRTPENVLYAILNDDNEFQLACQFVSKLQGWSQDEEEQSALVEIAKNA